eukprot:CAMPEP_0170067476 /NCGR_PEP_ID=MMETSP0019_2-20121128/6809_1 /TAXON_ID=98059 /ORGANISM="Dinobryon sp., Strain UTEXLB2267" /LENGTH=260 /DNA_ID=CAMNT_0010274875 /DNA_START=509 /DNA_END=1291 /DNA_ORIENTATION=-
MREIISPVLIRALCLVDDYHNDHNPNEAKVRLISNKLISGSSGDGPIDFVLSYLHFLITIGEAKDNNILSGLYQNLVQQHNALESLANKIIGFSVVGNERSQKFNQVMSLLRNYGTYGITSTGKEWMFSRTIPYSPGHVKARVFKSQVYALFVSSTATEIEKVAMKAQVGVLLRLIVKMIFNQIEAIEKNQNTNLNIKTLQTLLDSREYSSKVIAEDVLRYDESGLDEYDDENHGYEDESDDEYEDDESDGIQTKRTRYD